MQFQKPTLSLIFLLFFVPFLFSQQYDFSKVDKYAKETPTSKTQSIEKLADHLTKKFDSETEKVRSIYVWLTDNIKYNHRVVNNNNISIEQRLKKEKAARVLKSKWAVCEGYSNLFHELCNSAGIASEVVTGKVKKQDGKIAPIGHAWNVVRANGKWHPIDVTWGAGGLSGEKNKFVKKFNEQFFLAKPIDFIQNHFPKDPLFQLLENPINFDQFKKNDLINLPGNSASSHSFISLKDSLDFYFALEGDEKTMNSCKRILTYNPSSGYANNFIAKNHYDKAQAAWQVYQDESQEVFKKKKPLTWDMVEKWETKLAEFRKQRQLTEHYLLKIPSNDPYRVNKKNILASIKESKRLDPKIEKQFAEYKRYLNATGSPKN